LIINAASWLPDFPYLLLFAASSRLLTEQWRLFRLSQEQNFLLKWLILPADRHSSDTQCLQKAAIS